MLRSSLFVAAVTAAVLPAQAQTFEIIPFTYQPQLGGFQGSRVEGIARDGSVIIGEVCRFGDIGCGARRPVVWDPLLQMQTLPFSKGGVDEILQAASDNAGNIIVGVSTGLAATRWIGGPGGTIDRFIGPESGGGVARDVSADGVVVVGDTYVYDEESFAYARIFLKLGDGPVELLLPVDEHSHCRAYAIAGDGTTIVGSSYTVPGDGTFNPEVACIWSLDTLQPQTLPAYTGQPNAATYATDISSDGRVVIGAAVFMDEKLGFIRYLAIRWVKGPEGWSAPEDLLPDNDCLTCHASRVSADGRVIVGEFQRGNTFVWREGQATVDLAELLVAAGIDINDWTFPEANGLSDDGTTIVGNVYKRVCECSFCDCVIFNAGFRVQLDACAADFNGDDTLNSQDFFDFLTAFFAGAPGADFNQDQSINSQDFFDFLASFFAGC